MSRLLSELLAAEEPMFSMAIKQLEQASGNMSVDVRLTAEVVGKVHVKMKALGLDPQDTTGKELYQGLLGMLQRHDAFLAKRIGIRESDNVEHVFERITEVVQALDVPQKAWVLKPSVAKRLLKATPPKRVMKQLGYRSLDSMIKREPIGELFGAIRFMESTEWQAAFVKKYKSLKPTDFENRKIEIIQLDRKKWNGSAEQFVRNQHHNITHLKEVGVILILPLPVKRLPGITVTALALLLHYINEIRLYSSYFKSQQVSPKFSTTVVETLLDDPGKHASVAGQHVHWRIIHRHFGGSGREHPELFEPHVEPDDLVWRRTEETLYRLEPALHFWFDMDYVGVEFDGKPISFSLIDTAVNYVNQIAYGNQSIHYMRDSLWNEIYLRYMGEKSVEKQVLKQLNHGMIESETLVLD